MGAIVTLSKPEPLGRVPSYLLIDGQQRLTTLCILLAALRDCAMQHGENEFSERIDGLYLHNQFASGNDQWKVLSTHVGDRAAFIAAMEGIPSDAALSPLLDAYHFFRSNLPGETDWNDWERTLLSELVFVAISLDEADNPHRIFESLNAKSVRLTQADLLRNYFFMRLPPTEHEMLYSNLWEPMQQRLQGKTFDDFIRDYLVKDGQFVRSSDVYRTWKQKLEKLGLEGVRAELDALERFSSFYSVFVEPSREADDSIRSHLHTLNRLGGTTVYPYLLNLWNDESRGNCTDDDLANALILIESFLIRRHFCNVPPNELNRLFIRLYPQMGSEGDYVKRVWTALSRPSLRWPDDKAFEAGLRTYQLYRDSRPEQRRVILEAIEQDFGHKELVDLRELTVEHILPQTLNEAWREELGPDADNVHKTWLHTLANLTLTGYNPELSNSPFKEKQSWFKKSNLEMNKEISMAYDTWNENDLLSRSTVLTRQAIRIWPGPLGDSTYLF